MGAEYDQRDARGFINLIGLPIQVRASLKKAAKKRYETLGRPVRGRTLGGFRAFSGSLHFDRRLADADIRGRKLMRGRSEAWAFLRRAKRERSSLPSMLLREEARTPAFFDGADDEDVHTLVIRKLKDRAGELADKIHTGRSRNDQVSLDIRLWLRDEIDATRNLLLDLMAALTDGAA